MKQYISSYSTLNTLSILITLLSFLPLSTNAQESIFRKGQLILNLTGENCSTEIKTATLKAMIIEDNGAFKIEVPTVAFPFRSKKAKDKFNQDCFSLEDQPIITFEGQFENKEALKTKREGLVSSQLTGKWLINGEILSLSENIAIQIENGYLSFSFTTDATLTDLQLVMECEMSFKNKAKE